MADYETTLARAKKIGAANADDDESIALFCHGPLQTLCGHIPQAHLRGCVEDGAELPRVRPSRQYQSDGHCRPHVNLTLTAPDHLSADKRPGITGALVRAESPGTVAVDGSALVAVTWVPPGLT